MSAKFIFRASALCAAAVLASCGGDDKASAPQQEAPAVTDAPDGTTKAPSGGGSTTAAPSKPVSDLCSTVSLDELTDAFGSPFEKPTFTEHKETGQQQCVWANTDAPPAKIISLSVIDQAKLPKNFGGGMSVKELFEATRESVDGAVPLDIGEQSYRKAASVSVLLGNRSFSLDTTGSSTTAQEGAVKLARVVAERLK